MTNEELIAIIQAYREVSLGATSSQLSTERAIALDHYHGRPYGNEMEGRSQVVSKDLSETVDWIMPAIMRVFLQSGALAEFTPIGPNDEELAQQETEYTNHVIMNDNEGFILLHDAIKDALMLKNGYFKHYWEESEKTSEEEYEGLDENALTMLITGLEAEGAEVEIIEQEERQEYIETYQGQMSITVFDVGLRITRKEGCCVVEAVPPEELRISKRCRGNLQDSPFTEHVTYKTRTELIEMGMDEEFVYDLPSYVENEKNSIEAYARDSILDEHNVDEGSSVDQSLDEIEFCECYIQVDFNGDKRAELRKVVTVGNKIPDGDEWNEEIPAVMITGIQPKRVPHRHVGESLDDELADLQEIKTTLLRQMLDNVYLTNNQQYLINDTAHLPDFMRSVPGGFKRIKGTQPVTGMVEPLQTTPILNQILPAIDKIDSIKDSRTGISATTTGLDPDILNNTTKGAYLQNLTQASQKVEMVIRMLAETGIKELVKQVHGILVRYQDQPKVVKLSGKYVQVNPSEWKERTRLSVKVGLGTGTEEEKRNKLMIMSQLQQSLMPFGLVQPDQAYNLFKDIAKTLNFDMPEKYAIDPESPEYKQMMIQHQQQGQAPDPLVQAQQIASQSQQQIAQLKEEYNSQLKQMQTHYDAQLKIMQAQQDAIDKEADRRSKEAIETAKLEVQAMIAGYKMDLGKPGIGQGLQED